MHFFLFSYIARINENSPQGTALVFADPYNPQVNDDDPGKNGVFSLSLAGNNGTFEISPSVGERRANFIIKVRDNGLLDYEERQSVVFQVSIFDFKKFHILSTPINLFPQLINWLDLSVFLWFYFTDCSPRVRTSNEFINLRQRDCIFERR